MLKEYRIPLKIDNEGGKVYFYGSLIEVNEVLSSLWIDKKTN